VPGVVFQVHAFSHAEGLGTAVKGAPPPFAELVNETLIFALSTVIIVLGEVMLAAVLLLAIAVAPVLVTLYDGADTIQAFSRRIVQFAIGPVCLERQLAPDSGFAERGHAGIFVAQDALAFVRGGLRPFAAYAAIHADRLLGANVTVVAELAQCGLVRLLKALVGLFDAETFHAIRGGTVLLVSHAVSGHAHVLDRAEEVIVTLEAIFHRLGLAVPGVGLAFRVTDPLEADVVARNVAAVLVAANALAAVALVVQRTRVEVIAVQSILEVRVGALVQVLGAPGIATSGGATIPFCSVALSRITDFFHGAVLTVIALHPLVHLRPGHLRCTHFAGCTDVPRMGVIVVKAQAVNHALAVQGQVDALPLFTDVLRAVNVVAGTGFSVTQFLVQAATILIAAVGCAGIPVIANRPFLDASPCGTERGMRAFETIIARETFVDYGPRKRGVVGVAHETALVRALRMGIHHLALPFDDAPVDVPLVDALPGLAVAAVVGALEQVITVLGISNADPGLAMVERGTLVFVAARSCVLDQGPLGE